MKINFKDELLNLYSAIKSLNKKVVIVLLSVAVLQTISWYFTSRQFFRSNFYYTIFEGDTNAGLYEFIYWFLGDFAVFFICGALLIKLVFKEKVRDYGLNLNEKQLGFTVVLPAIVIMCPVIWIVSASPSFAESYPLLQMARTDWGIFLVFQIFLLAFLFAWEFFWRGYMLFGLKKEFGYYAVLIQMIPFVILHNGKPFTETSGAILGALALGILAYRTGSFIYGVIIHYGVMIMIDFFSIMRYRTGNSGTGIDSFFQIVSKIF